MSPQSKSYARGKRNRRERELARAKGEIVAAAARAFARRGLYGTTMEEIASEAGYGTSSLYTYFKGKDEIIRALFGAVGAQFNEVRAEPILERLAFPERLEWLVARHFAVIEKNRDFFLAFYAHRGSFEICCDRELEKTAREGNRRWHEFMTSFVQKGMDEGHVRSGDAAELAQFSIGTLHGVVMRWLTEGPVGALEKKALPLCEFLLRGMAAGRERLRAAGGRP